MTETTTNSVELAEGPARLGSVLEQPPAGQRRHAGRPRPHRQRVRRELDELQRQPHDQSSSPPTASTATCSPTPICRAPRVSRSVRGWTGSTGAYDLVVIDGVPQLPQRRNSTNWNSRGNPWRDYA